MTAAEDMSRALLGMADRFERPPCGNKATAHLWTAEDAADRALAIPLCAGCPIGELCGAYAEEINATWGVWNAHDLTTQTIRKRKNVP